MVQDDSLFEVVLCTRGKCRVLVRVGCRSGPQGWIVKQYDAALLSDDLKLVLSDHNGGPLIDTDAEQCRTIDAIVHLVVGVGKNFDQAALTLTWDDVLIDSGVCDESKPALMVTDQNAAGFGVASD